MEVTDFAVPGSGLSSRQVWSAVIDELQRGGAMPRIDIDAWVRTSALVAADDAELALGVPNVLAERRAAGRYRVTLEDAIQRVTGIRFALRIVLGATREENQRASGA